MIFYYLTAFVFGFLGAAILFRSAELAFGGAPVSWLMVGVGIVFLLIAFAAGRRGREAFEDEEPSSLGKTVFWGALVVIAICFVSAIVFSASFLLHQGKHRSSRSPTREASASTATQKPSPARPPAVVAPRGDGTFIAAPDRVDMVHDPKRNVLYITSGDSVLRYQMASNVFLPPLVLGGKLRGIDLSPDNDCLAVADADGKDGRVGVYLVNLNTEGISPFTFPMEFHESGTYAVAFGADGGVWISSSFAGSGFVPLRKLDPVTRHWMQIGTVSQNTMLAASADRQVIAFAQANISSGVYGRIRYRATQLPPTPLEAQVFIYEIGVNRDGTRLAIPAGDHVLLSGAKIPKLAGGYAVAAAWHPKSDNLFLACRDSSLVSAYDAQTGSKVRDYDFGERFPWTGRAFESGRLRLSADGKWLFCTVNGGVRFVATDLN